MENKKELDVLINKINNIPSDVEDKELIDIYNQVIEVLNSNKYSQKEKDYFKENAWLEMLLMCCDGIV